MKAIGYTDVRLRFTGVEFNPGATWPEIEAEIWDEIHRAERVLHEHGFKLSFDHRALGERPPAITHFDVQVCRLDWEQHPEIREYCR